MITLSVPTPDSAEILVDALNVAWWCGAPPSLRFPVALLAALLRRGDRARLYFDASAPHQLAHERAEYDELIAITGLAQQVPRGTPADRLLLRDARDRAARIVSPDRFGDHRIRYRRIIDDPARLLTGGVEAGTLRVPGLDLTVPVPSYFCARELLVTACGIPLGSISSS